MHIFDSICWLLGFSCLFCMVVFAAGTVLLALAELLAFALMRATKQAHNVKVWAEFIAYKREKKHGKLIDNSK